jgi:hypothetical protein
MDFGWMVSLILVVVTAVGLWRTGLSYVKGDLKGSKREIKGFVMVCFAIGIIPGLGSISVNLGKSVVNPVNAIVNSIAHKVETEAVKSVQGQ